MYSSWTASNPALIRRSKTALFVAASGIGLVGGVAWAVVYRDWSAPFGFGPAIAVGALVVVLLPHRMLFLG